MAYEFTYKKMVDFLSADMAGILHFSNYFRFMEETEHAFYRFLGLDGFQTVDGGFLCWPRINASLSYKKALFYKDELEIHLRVVGKTQIALKLHFTFRELGSGDLAAEGSYQVVYAYVDALGKTIKAKTIPAEISERIQVVPKDPVTEVLALI